MSFFHPPTGDPNKRMCSPFRSPSLRSVGTADKINSRENEREIRLVRVPCTHESTGSENDTRHFTVVTHVRILRRILWFLHGWMRGWMLLVKTKGNRRGTEIFLTGLGKKKDRLSDPFLSHFLSLFEKKKKKEKISSTTTITTATTTAQENENINIMDIFFIELPFFAGDFLELRKQNNFSSNTLLARISLSTYSGIFSVRATRTPRATNPLSLSHL